MDVAARGRWASLFAERLSFDEEIAHAVEVQSQWTAHSQQVDVIVEEIAGWLPPMWGADSRWLYLRRPEGLWKTRIALAPKEEALALLYQEKSLGVGRRKILGGMSMGMELSAAKGWIRGADASNLISAAERDERSLEATKIHGSNLDAVARSWGRLVREDGDRLTLEAGDHFDEPPDFEMQGRCLVGTDRSSGRRVAFAIGSDQLMAAVVSGRLALHFSSRWFDEFVAPVPAMPT